MFDSYYDREREWRRQSRLVAQAWIHDFEQREKLTGEEIVDRVRQLFDRMSEEQEGEKPTGTEQRADQAFTEEAFYVQLGQNFLNDLIRMRRDTDFYSSLPREERTEDVVRDVAWSMLRHLTGMAWVQNHELDLGLNLEPLHRLLHALADVENGFNNRLLVTGDLANKLHAQSYSEWSRELIQARAAAIVEVLLYHKVERFQIAAARRVATALHGAGYMSGGSHRSAEPVGADTVKRWHNRARRLAELASRLTEEEWTGLPSNDRKFCEHYLSRVFHWEHEVMSQRKRYAIVFDTTFDVDGELAELKRFCRELRTFD